MFVNTDNYSEVRAKAVSFIGISHKSSGRVRDFLIGCGVERSLADQVVDTLIEDGYIDDLRVARGIASARQGRKSESNSRLRQRLLNYGIPDQTICELMEEIRTDSQNIEILVNEMYGNVDFSFFNSEELNAWILSAVRFLSGRGFSRNISLCAIRKLVSRNDLS